MHILQPKHFKLKKEDAEELLAELNISLAQLPKIKQEDPALPTGSQVGDIIRVERKFDSKVVSYYRVVV